MNARRVSLNHSAQTAYSPRIKIKPQLQVQQAAAEGSKNVSTRGSYRKSNIFETVDYRAGVPKNQLKSI